jgi:hypothetical protein
LVWLTTRIDGTVREYFPYGKKNTGKETHAHRPFVGIVPPPPPVPAAARRKNKRGVRKMDIHRMQ